MEQLRGGSCKVGLAGGGFVSTDDAGDVTVMLRGRFGSYVAAGLSPSTTYGYRSRMVRGRDGADLRNVHEGRRRGIVGEAEDRAATIARPWSRR